MTATTFSDRAARFSRVLDSVTDFDAPTPCEDWTVSGVLEHVITTERDFLQRQGLEVGAMPDLGSPAEAWQDHLQVVDAALSQPGVAQREYDGYFGRTTVGDTMADFYGWDLMIHGWDIARASGQPSPISDEEAEALSATADEWGQALYSDGVCATAVPVPEDAPAADRLLGRLGRDPGWTPAG